MTSQADSPNGAGLPGSHPVSRYEFGPLSTRGLVAGWRSGQIVSVACGVLLAIGFLHGGIAPTRVILALGSLGLGIACACWPVGGQTPEQWLPVVLRWSFDAFFGRHHARSSAPTDGFILPGTRPSPSMLDTPATQRPAHARPAPATQRPARARPDRARPAAGPFAGLRVCDLADSRGAMGTSRAGAIFDPNEGATSAVLLTSGAGFPLWDPGSQDQHIGSWARVLTSLDPGVPGMRLQWVARTWPEDCEALHQDFALRSHGPSDARASYRNAISETSQATWAHEVLVVLRHAPTSRGMLPRRRKTTQPHRRHPGTTTGKRDEALPVHDGSDLLRDARLLSENLRAGGIPVHGMLSSGALARRLWLAINAKGGALEGGAPYPWPLAIEESWSHVRTDGAYHTTFWVEEWPRSPVPGDFLAPLLLEPGFQRSISLVIEPVPTREAMQLVTRERVADMADGELRARGGFLITMRTKHEARSTMRREAEIASGHTLFRYSGFVTTSAHDLEELGRARSALATVASRSQLVLRCCYGRQAEALMWTLPIARGLL